jgi:hypothetical protein
MLKSAYIYQCEPKLAVFWPQAVTQAGYLVSNLQSWTEPWGFETVTGIIHHDRARVQVHFGFKSNVLLLVLAFRVPLFFGRPGRAHRLAAEIEKVLIKVGAKRLLSSSPK